MVIEQLMVPGAFFVLFRSADTSQRSGCTSSTSRFNKTRDSKTWGRSKSEIDVTMWSGWAFSHGLTQRKKGFQLAAWLDSVDKQRSSFLGRRQHYCLLNR